jgi:hypothetical protein
VKVLKKDRCIDMDGYGKITLTEKGEAIAGRIYERHLMLTRYLVALGVSEKVAADDACRLEHVLSEQSFVKIVEHYRNALSGDAAGRGGAGGVRGASGGASGKGAVAAAGSSAAAAGGGAAKAKIGAGANPGAYEDEYVTADGEAGAKAGGAGAGAKAGASKR